MKRELKATREVEVKAPGPAKGIEREFAEANQYMIDQMAKLFKNQVLLAMNKGTVEKFADSIGDWPGSFLCKIPHTKTVDGFTTVFVDSNGTEYDESEIRRLDDDFVGSLDTVSVPTKNDMTWYAVESRAMMASEYIKLHGVFDAQTGNFAKVYLKLADQVKRKLLKRFSNDRLSKMSKKYTGKMDKRNSSVFYNQVESKVGISKQQLEATEGLTFTINAYQAETAQWIGKLRDETMQGWVSNTLRMMAEGDGLEDILGQFDDMVEKRKGHAKMVARTQISTYNSLVTKARAQNLGIEKAIWVTARDERVRPSHQARDGKEFDLAEGLYSSIDNKTLLPGVDYNCRCSYRLVIPEE